MKTLIVTASKSKAYSFGKSSIDILPVDAIAHKNLNFTETYGKVIFAPDWSAGEGVTMNTLMFAMDQIKIVAASTCEYVYL